MESDVAGLVSQELDAELEANPSEVARSRRRNLLSDRKELQGFKDAALKFTIIRKSGCSQKVYMTRLFRSQKNNHKVISYSAVFLTTGTIEVHSRRD